MRALFPALLMASCGLLASHGAGAASTAIEYYHVGDRNYCVASSPKEVAALDAGVISGWTRTGRGFAV